MARIFLSHSSRNNAPAVALADWLALNGWGRDDIFLDIDPASGIAPGERWQKALNDAAGRCEAVVFLISRDWLASRWCHEERALAHKLNKRLFGVLIDTVEIKDVPARLRDEWQLIDLESGRDGKRIDVELPGGQQAFATLSASGLDRLRAGLVKAGLDPRHFPWPPKEDPDRAPYRGLAPMEAEDAGIFYGREAATIAALDQLRGLAEAAPRRLMAVLGASGAGKSSFMRAGLIPRLKRDDRNFLVLPILRPERAAISAKSGLVASIEGAAKALGLKWTRANIARAAVGDATGVAALLSELAATATLRLAGSNDAAAPAIVLPIDQAEELSLAEGRDEAQAFLALLAALLNLEQPRLVALLTIRTDSYEKLQQAPALTEIGQLPFNLPALARGAYQRVIEGPAERLAGTARTLKIEPALTSALLSDIEQGGAKDALPLLAFTLERLYADHGSDGDLTLAEYEDSRRISGAIEVAVEQALHAADSDPGVPKDKDARLALLRRAMIPWLAGIDPETKTPRRQVARFTDIPDEARPLIEHFVEQRLLATDVSPETGERTIEPAHEALLRQWGLIDGWLKEDIAVLATLEGVRRAARDWDANRRDANWLSHNGGRLEDAEAIKSRVDLARRLDATDLAYLDAARTAETTRRDHELEEARKLAEEQRKNAEAQALVAQQQKTVARRTRIGSVVASILALLAVAAALYGFRQAERADDARLVAEAESHRAEQETKRAEEAAALANEQQQKAEASAREASFNETTSLAALSRVAEAEGFPVDAVKLALAAWPRRGDERRPTLRRSIESLMQALQDVGERVRLSGHTAPVFFAAFSPDGTRVVTAANDFTARAWDATTGAQLALLEGHEGYVVASAAISPDGTRVVTASNDSTARIWDADTGAQLALLNGHANDVSSAVFSPDGTRIVTASNDDTARVWEADTGAQLALLKGHTDDVSSAVFSPDGTRVVTASSDSTARVWDAATGAQLALLKGPEGFVRSATFSADGTRIVTVSPDTAVIWDAVTGAQLALLKGHKVSVLSATFSPDGTRIVTASGDYSAGVWDAATGAQLALLKGHEGSVLSATFSADGTRIVTASADRTARVWDATSGNQLALLKGHEDAVHSAAFSPDGRRIVTASLDKTARVWDVSALARFALLKGHEYFVVSAAFSPDSKLVVTASWDNTARTWDAASGDQLTLLNGHANHVFSAVFSPAGARIVTASEDKTARVWDALTGVPLALLTGHGNTVASADFSPDGKRIVTGSWDDTARVWDAATGDQLALLKGHQAVVGSAAFSPDGTRIVTASEDGTARVWDAAGDDQLALLNGHEDLVTSAAFSPDGRRIVTASWDDTARVWDAANGDQLELLSGHEDIVNSAAFSPDGTHIVTASQDDTARVWDAASGAQLAILHGHEGDLDSAAFSPDGTRIVTASVDGTARVWDADTGAQLALLIHQNPVSFADFSPNGTRIVTTSQDYAARVWDISVVEKGDVFQIACQRLGNNTDLSDVEARYGLSKLTPICGDHPPLPVDRAKLQ